ncbi:hypothetical protein [Acinetobacter sp. WCHAc010052]|uniref:hypothetical protein n=1 Tax=Acinetobacter sp. WCHAc010052 TaxID=2004647 RepID=UPI000B3D47C3|nr:hypothetical protein [Acinetobacter sp. WCHAc010052]AXY60699.1 hypothetical protein CDG61_12115 [Acinetobacter sp. WCHAc010052]
MNILFEPGQFASRNQSLLNRLNELDDMMRKLKASSRSVKYQQIEAFLSEMIRLHGHDIKNDYYIKIEFITRLTQLAEHKTLSEKLKKNWDEIYHFFVEKFSIQQKQEICLFFLIQYKQIVSDLQNANRLHVEQLFDVEKYSYLYQKFQGLPKLQLNDADIQQLEQKYNEVLIRQLANSCIRFRLIHEDCYYLEKIVTNILLSRLKKTALCFSRIYG